MNVEDSITFSLSLLNFYGSAALARSAATYTSGEPAATMVGYVTSDVAWTMVREVVGWTVGCMAWEATWNVTWKSTHHEVERMAAEKNPQQIAKVCCQSVITHRRKIEEAIKKKCWDKMPDVFISGEEKVGIIRTLLTYDDSRFESLKKIIPLQLHRVFFELEYLIKVDAKLTEPQEKILMVEHGELLKKLGMETSYANLFLPITELEAIIPLPTVLIRIIKEYIELPFTDSDYAEEILHRISCMD